MNTNRDASNPWQALSHEPLNASPSPTAGMPRRPRLPSIGGVRVLVPKPSENHPICQALERRGAIPVPLELTRLEPASPAVIGNALAMLATSAWALFLTERAVTTLQEDGRPLTPLVGVSRMTAGLKVAAASPTIAHALDKADIPVDLTPLHGEGTMPLILSLPRGPLAPALPTPPGDAANATAADAPAMPDFAGLPGHVNRAPAEMAAAALALLGLGPAPSTPEAAKPRAPHEIPHREKRIVLLGSNVIDPRARALAGVLGWEVEALTLHTTQPTRVTPAEVARALAYRSGGRPRWPGIVLVTSPATVHALLTSVGKPPPEVAVAAADEPTARAALAADMRVDAIAAHNTYDSYAAACEGAWHRAFQAGVLRES